MSNARKLRLDPRRLERSATPTRLGSAATDRWPRAAPTSRVPLGPEPARSRPEPAAAEPIPPTRAPCGASATKCEGWRTQPRSRSATWLEGPAATSRLRSAGATRSYWTCRLRRASASRRSASWPRCDGSSARSSQRTRSSRRRSALSRVRLWTRTRRSDARSSRRSRRRRRCNARSSGSARRTGGCSSAEAVASDPRRTAEECGGPLRSPASSASFSRASRTRRRR